MNEEMVKIFRQIIQNEKKPLYDAIANYIRKGEKNTVCAQEIRSILVKFDTGDGVGVKAIESVPDYSKMTEEEIMPYIYTYVMEGKLPDLIAFGATQVDTF
jgi:predicted peroxiredoxin